jgi:glycerophosphoryl diester phosphodiesterase
LHPDPAPSIVVGSGFNSYRLSLPSLPLTGFYKQPPLNFAHRGARQQAPENTLPAFERAIMLHADGIELDVQLTADNEIVVYHDQKLGRTSEGQGEIRQWKLEALRELDAGTHFSPSFTGTTIPTLTEVFAAVGHRVLINIEIKPFVQRDIVAPLIASNIYRHNLEDRVLVSSFNPWILREMRKQAPDIPRGFLIENASHMLLKQDRLLRTMIGPFQARHPHFSDVDARYVDWAHTHGYRINVWTVNELDDIQRMMALGVDMIISDVPDVVHSLV